MVRRFVNTWIPYMALGQNLLPAQNLPPIKKPPKTPKRLGAKSIKGLVFILLRRVGYGV